MIQRETRDCIQWLRDQWQTVLEFAPPPTYKNEMGLEIYEGLVKLYWQINEMI